MSWHFDLVAMLRAWDVFRGAFSDPIFLIFALGAAGVAVYLGWNALKLLKEIGSRDEIADDVASLTKGRNIKPDGGVGKAYQALREIRGLSNADPAAAVRNALSAYETRAGGLLALPNLCMIFGLMGTVAIFASVMPQMQGTIQQAAAGANRPDVVSSVAGAFPGTGTAFCSTFWGLLWTVVAYGLARRTYWRVRQRMAEITNQMMEKVAPSLFGDPLARLSTAAENIQGVLNTATATLEKMQTGFGEVERDVRETTEGLGKHVREFNQAITEAGGQFKEIAGDVREVGNKLGANLTALQQVQTTIEQEFQKVLDKIESLLREHHVWLTTFTQNAVDLREKLDDTVATISSRLKETSEDIAQELHRAARAYTAELSRVNEEHRQGLANVVTSIHNSASRFDDATMRFKEAGEKFENMSSEIGEKAYQAVNSQMESIAKRLDDYSLAVHNLEEAIRRLQSTIEQFDPKALHPDRWGELMGRMDAVVERLPVGGGEEISRTDGQIARLTDAVTRMEIAVTRMESAVRSLAVSPQASQSDGLGPRLDEIRDLNQKTLAELQRMVNQQTRIITLLESSRRGVWQRVGSALGALFRRGR